MRNIWKKIIYIASAVILLGAVFFGGIYIGSKMPGESKVAGVINMEPNASLSASQTDFGAFWGAWSILERKYVDIGKIERSAMVDGAISGLVKSMGDPYTVYLPPEDLKELEIEISGKFEGVGMEIGIKDEILTVVAPLKNTPAERAGLKAGDKILKVDDKTTQDLTVADAVKLIRGPHGTKVKLTILRGTEDSPRVIEVTRDIINIPVLDTETNTKVADANGKTPEKKTDIPKDVFVIKLYNFSEGSSSQFRQALREMTEGGYTKLVLDLRNNPGGYLEAAVDISSWFLPQGKIVVQEDFGKDKGKDREVHRSKGYDIFRNLPMVILVNRGSASASEIVSGALHDNGIAKLVGEKTFGKGSVQEIVPLTGDSSIKVTIAKWLTPNGVDISKEGIAPDYEVKVSEKDEASGRDLYMEKALEILKTM
ncbi:S41 family peptidase [Candidatus Giovannonibacteria bacterium]|nr:S41 family peptidase [Candidatus Giovannonibacteria bacterium]